MLDHYSAAKSKLRLNIDEKLRVSTNLVIASPHLDPIHRSLVSGVNFQNLHSKTPKWLFLTPFPVDIAASSLLKRFWFLGKGLPAKSRPIRLFPAVDVVGADKLDRRRRFPHCLWLRLSGPKWDLCRNDRHFEIVPNVNGKSGIDRSPAASLTLGKGVFQKPYIHRFGMLAPPPHH